MAWSNSRGAVARFTEGKMAKPNMTVSSDWVQGGREWSHGYMRSRVHRPLPVGRCTPTIRRGKIVRADNREAGDGAGMPVTNSQGTCGGEIGVEARLFSEAGLGGRDP